MNTPILLDFKPLWFVLLILAGFTPSDYAWSLVEHTYFAPPPGDTAKPPLNPL